MVTKVHGYTLASYHTANTSLRSYSSHTICQHMHMMSTSYFYALDICIWCPIFYICTLSYVYTLHLIWRNTLHLYADTSIPLMSAIPLCVGINTKGHMLRSPFP